MYLYEVSLYGDGGRVPVILQHTVEYSEEQFQDILMQAVEKSFLQEKERFLKENHSEDMFPLMQIVAADIYATCINLLKTEHGFEQVKLTQQVFLEESFPQVSNPEALSCIEKQFISTLEKLNKSLYLEKYHKERLE